MDNTTKNSITKINCEPNNDRDPKRLEHIENPIIVQYIDEQAAEDFYKFFFTNNFSSNTSKPIFTMDDYKDNSNFTKSSVQQCESLNAKDQISENDPNITKECKYLDGEVIKIICKTGKSHKKPKKGDICKLDIIGRLMNNGQLVDKLLDVEIQIGDLEVIEGLDYAIEQMEVGEIAYIKIAPRYAYGRRGKINVPCNAALKYKVTLKSIKAEPKIRSLSIEELVAISKKKRLRGNWWFDRMQLNHAITCYEGALKYSDPSSDSSSSLMKKVRSSYLRWFLMGWKVLQKKQDYLDEESKQRSYLGDERMDVQYSLGTAYMKQGDYDHALKIINSLLQYCPTFWPAQYKKGLLLKLKEEYEASYMIFLEISQIDFIYDIDGLQGEIDFVRKKVLEQQKYRKDKIEVKEDFKIGSNSNYKRTNYTLNNDKVENKNKFIQRFLSLITEVTYAAITIAIVRRYFC